MACFVSNWFSFFSLGFVVPQVRAMECIRQLLLRSGEALFLLQLLSQHHVTRLIQGFDSNLQQALVQLTFHQLVCSEEGDHLATRLISVLMEVNPCLGSHEGDFIYKKFMH